MRVIHDPSELPQDGCVFVPTMGALHIGHSTLIKSASAFSLPTVVSIFVNPTQFAPDEDFRAYPRAFDDDIELAYSAGADFVFAPTETTVYPKRLKDIPLPKVASEPKLEDSHRPTHFQGVCNVVARFFDLVHPKIAIFGEKDYQQLKVIQAMVQNEKRWHELDIVSIPTVRDDDGVALSSRNVYLSIEERTKACAIVQALSIGREDAMRHALENADLIVDYAVIRDAETLMAPQQHKPKRALIAARAGETRLIDNGALP